MRLVRIAATSAKGHKSTRPSLPSRRLGSWGRGVGLTERLVNELQRLERGLRDLEERPDSASSHAGADGVCRTSRGRPQRERVFAVRGSGPPGLWKPRADLAWRSASWATRSPRAVISTTRSQPARPSCQIRPASCAQAHGGPSAKRRRPMVGVMARELVSSDEQNDQAESTPARRILKVVVRAVE